MKAENEAAAIKAEKSRGASKGIPGQYRRVKAENEAAAIKAEKSRGAGKRGQPRIIQEGEGGE